MISLVIRSKNDAALIGATIQGILSQDLGVPIERIHIDSGSTDGTVEIIEASRPEKFIRIRAEDYVPGVVLNRGMREASGSWVVFVNSDCEPVDSSWLRELMAATRGEHIGAVYGRQQPRPDCQAVYAHDYDRCFGEGRAATQWDHFFSMANSAVNREAWAELPFREDLQYSEDDEWSRRLVKHGWKVVYAEAAAVMHSHNYTLRQAFRRCYGEAFALAALETVQPHHFGFLRTVVTGGLREGLRDLGYCLRRNRLTEWPHALAVRAWQRAGKVRGFRDGWRHYQGGKALA